MTELSPAALAVMDAVVKVYPAFPDEVAAAAIKAVADQVVPEQPEPDNDTKWRAFVRYEERNSLRTKLLSIATELECPLR